MYTVAPRATVYSPALPCYNYPLLDIKDFSIIFNLKIMRHRMIHISLILLIYFWNLLIILPPILKTEFPDISGFLYSFFGHICHQLDSRSIHILGGKLGVCSRCWGIYSGFLIGTLITTFINFKKTINTRNIIIIASIPILLDIALDTVIIHESNLITKVLSGFIFGLVISSAILFTLNEAIIELINKRVKKCTKNQTNSYQHFMVE